MLGLFQLFLRLHGWRSAVILSLFLSVSLTGRAQYGPVLDPAFQSPTLLAPALVRGALQLSDGSRVVAGSFIKADGQPSSGLVRYQPNGQPDTGFNTRTQANTWAVETVREAPGGKLLVQFTDTARVSGQLCASLARLLPNGRRDSTFTSPAVPFAQIDALLVLPDGSVLLGVPTGVVRLLPDGTADTAFFQQYGGAFQGGRVTALARQADGKLLVGGDFATVQGVARPGLARLLANGPLDTSYQPALPATTVCISLLVQPGNDHLLCTYYVTSATGPGSAPQLTRLLPATGAADATFQSDPTVSIYYRSSKWPTVQVQSDGAILLSGMHTAGGRQQSFIIRLSPTGTYDPTWEVPFIGNTVQNAASIQVLPTGQVLATASAAKTFVTSTPASQVAVLGTTGAYIPGFRPVLQTTGYVSSVVMQADGKILIAGGFSEVNGTAMDMLARLLPNGSLDTSYRTGCPLVPLLDTPPTAPGYIEPRIVLQPDGKLLVSGLATPGSNLGLLRLLPTGCPDPSFVPALQAGFVQSLSQQPTGEILLIGVLQPVGTYTFITSARLTAGGGLDAAYQLTNGSQSPFQDQLLAQPDGTALLLNTNLSSPTMTRYLANGTVDPTFLVVSLQAFSSVGRAQARGLTRDAASRLLIFGELGGIGSVVSGGVVRTLANGIPDATFQTSLFTGAFTVVTAVAEQPNGRILVGSSGDFGLQRLLPDGQLDGSFDFTQGPSDGQVRTIAVQPDGAILVGGTFRRVGQRPCASLARLLAPYVLAVSPQQLIANTLVYPVPAHDQLHLRLDAASRPRQVQLLDVLGRVVLTQLVAQSDLTLNTACLPAGVYFLQVDYAQGGRVTRRVTLE